MGRLFCLSVFSSKSKVAKTPLLSESVAPLETKSFSSVNIPETHTGTPPSMFVHHLPVVSYECANAPCVNIELASLSEGTLCGGSSVPQTDESDVECVNHMQKVPSCIDMLYDNYYITDDGVDDQFTNSARYSDEVPEMTTERHITVPDDISNMDSTQTASFPDEISSRDDSDPGLVKSAYNNPNLVLVDCTDISCPTDSKNPVFLQLACSDNDAIMMVKDSVFNRPQDSLSKGFIIDVPNSLHTRIDEWINSSEQSVLSQIEDNVFTHHSGSDANHEALPDAVIIEHSSAGTAVRSLHASSTVGHLCGIGLREIPRLGMYTLLKTLNLSANNLERISPGCLPRNLHSLDLSRNRISQIEGFKELTRLRVLNISSNKITRIGHGLASCTLLKELYLGGNRICEVEGLHRLLKLVVLDLGSNKLASTKSLCQLAANYNSLVAVNLLGNPVLVNVGEDQVQKLLKTLTPNVVYLNQNPTKSISFKEIVSDRVARAALGSQKRNKQSNGKSSGRGGSQFHKKSSHHHQQGGYKKPSSVSSTRVLQKRHESSI